MPVRRVFEIKTFRRWLRKSPLTEADLCAAVAEMVAGLIDADLGGHLFKKRIASPGRGKSGGARVLVGTNLGSRWFFVFGFEKSARANIDDRELAALQKLADVLLRMEPRQLSLALESGELTEICHEEEPNSA